MNVSVSGLSFSIGPDEILSVEERRSLSRWPPGVDTPSFRLSVSDADDTLGGGTGEPACVDFVAGRVEVNHAAFHAELNVVGGNGRLRRAPGPAFPVEITLRIALSSWLPLIGGLPLHAAGLVVEHRGVAFFGPSGAGKSTLAKLSPYHVLSDELVSIIGGDRFGLAASGFWGAVGGGDACAGPFPLAAVVELGRGRELTWIKLSPQEAARRLLHVILVPPGAPLWTPALRSLARLVREVPLYRMEWNPATVPWLEIARRIGGAH